MRCTEATSGTTRPAQRSRNKIKTACTGGLRVAPHTNEITPIRVVNMNSFLARNREAIGFLAAISIGCSSGGVTLGLVDALRGNDTRALALWNAGTTGLIAGAGLGAASARGSIIQRRMDWRRQ